MVFSKLKVTFLVVLKVNIFLRSKPVFVVNQNLNPKILEFFLTLWHVLGRTGSLTLIKNKYGNIVIRLSSENWDTILNIYANYFQLIYGEKYIAFQKLSTIRHLTSNQLRLDPSSLALATLHTLFTVFQQMDRYRQKENYLYMSN